MFVLRLQFNLLDLGFLHEAPQFGFAHSTAIDSRKNGCRACGTSPRLQ